MNIEKTISVTTQVCKGVIKSINPKVGQVIQDSCCPEKLTSSLNTLAVNAKAGLVKNISPWNESHLKSIPPSKRLEALVQQGDKTVPTSHKLTEWLTLAEKRSYCSWAKGWTMSNHSMQQDFNKIASKQGVSFWQDVKNLDNLIKSAAPLQEDCIAYRGLIGQESRQVKFIESIKEGMIIPHQTYVGTASKITPYTRKFLCGNETLVVMRIKLPKGTRGILINEKLDEFVLPRGTNIKINKIDSTTGVIDAEYILPDKDIEIPKWAQDMIDETNRNKPPKMLAEEKTQAIRCKLYQYFETNYPDKFDEIFDEIFECRGLKALKNKFGDIIAKLNLDC